MHSWLPPLLQQCMLNNSKLQKKSKECKLEESLAQVQLKEGHQICSVSQIANNTEKSTTDCTEVQKPKNRKMSLFRSSKKKEKKSGNSKHLETTQQKTSSRPNSGVYTDIPPLVDMDSHPLRQICRNSLHSSSPNLAPKQNISKGNSPLSVTPLHREQLYRHRSEEILDPIHSSEKQVDICKDRQSSQVRNTSPIETNDGYSRLRIIEDPIQKTFDGHIARPRPGDYSRLNIKPPSRLDDVHPQTDEELSEVVVNHHYFTLEIMEDKNDTQSLDPQPDEELSSTVENHYYFTLEEVNGSQSHENYLLETSPTPHEEEMNTEQTRKEDTSNSLYSYVEVDLKDRCLVPSARVNHSKDSIRNNSCKQKTRDDVESHYSLTSHVSRNKKDLLMEEITPTEYLMPTSSLKIQPHSQKPFPMLRTSSAGRFQYRTKHTSPSPPPHSSFASPISSPGVNRRINGSFKNSLYSNSDHMLPTTSSRQKSTSPLYERLRYLPPSFNKAQTVGHHSELRRERIHSDSRHDARSPQHDQLHEVNINDIDNAPLSPPHNLDEFSDTSDDDVVLSPFLPDISSPNGQSDTENQVDDKTKEQNDSPPHDSHVRLIITDNGPILLPTKRSFTNPNIGVCRFVSNSDDQPPRSSSVSSNRIEKHYEFNY